MRVRIAVAFAVVALAACAVGSGDEGSGAPGSATEEGGSIPMPEGSETGFDAPAPGSSGSSGSSGASGSSGGTSSSSSSGASGSSSGSTSGSTSSSSGSTSSSGASGSSTSSSSSSSSSGGASGACGVCDRYWTCNAMKDLWSTEGARCVNQRTKTALRCDGKFDQGTSFNVGTWSGNTAKITLVYPMLGGGTKSYDCFP